MSIDREPETGEVLSWQPKRKQSTYTVTGRWPFPVDMLRYDEAKPATPADEDVLKRLTGEFYTGLPDDLQAQHTVTLVTERQLHAMLENKRWLSFGWRVVMVDGVAVTELPPKPDWVVKLALTREEVDRFRALRLHHWNLVREASRRMHDMRASHHTLADAKKAWALHMGFVQIMNDLFPEGDTAERDATRSAS